MLGRTKVDSHFHLAVKSPIYASPPRGEVSIPQVLAPVSTECLILHSGALGCILLSERAVSLETTGGSGVPVCIVYEITDLDLDHIKLVAPWGKPLGLEPPMQGTHVQQAKRYHVGHRCAG